MNDADLVRLISGCARDDLEAMATLFDETGGLVFRMCLLVLRDPLQARRCTATAFATIWADARHYDPNFTSPLAWLSTVAYLSAREARGPGVPPR